MTDLIVALDFDTLDEAESLVEKLSGLPVLFKIGPELFLAKGGRDFVHDLADSGSRVFLDLKFHDIPNTVAQAAAQSKKMGIEMFTVHLTSGPKAIQEIQARLGSRRPKILGVSVLTSFDQSTWDEVTIAVTGNSHPIAESVFDLVSKGVEWGVDGVVCSAHEVESISKKFPELYTVVPGIRLDTDSKNDQSRVVTPKQAKSLGAKAIVVGRSITHSVEPRKTCEQILNIISE